MRPTKRISTVSLVAAGLLLAANAVADPKGKDEQSIHVNRKGREEADRGHRSESELRLAINRRRAALYN